ncbi:hypothetical protein P885DRAFT_82333 [Corynascus similis CBS 632.67]
MTVQQKLRFSEVDEESVNTLLRAYLDNAIEEEANDRGNIDSRRFWMDFARDPKAPEVQAPVKAFLHTYVESSYQERVVLGPEERAMVRTVNCTFSVIEVWRRLIVAADFKVLYSERAALRRRERHLEADRLFLKWPQEGEKRDGPAYTIVKIIQSLSPELNLEMNSSYGKVEATAEDIIIILKRSMSVKQIYPLRHLQGWGSTTRFSIWLSAVIVRVALKIPYVGSTP